jgi:hypothetical protein
MQTQSTPGKLFDREFVVATFMDMKSKQDRGRPPLPPEERKAAELRIRLTEAQRALLDEAAGQDTSTWAREVLLRAAKRRSK